MQRFSSTCCSVGIFAKAFELFLSHRGKIDTIMKKAAYRLYLNYYSMFCLFTLETAGGEGSGFFNVPVYPSMLGYTGTLKKPESGQGKGQLSA